MSVTAENFSQVTADPVAEKTAEIIKAGGHALVLAAIPDPAQALGRLYQMVMDDAPAADIGLRLQVVVRNVIRSEAETRADIEPMMLRMQAD